MANPLLSRKSMFFLWVIVATMIVGCEGRRITTAVEDQTFQPGPSHATPVEATRVPPPVEEERMGTAPSTTPVEEASPAEQPAAPAPKPVSPGAELSDIFFDFDQYAIRSEARSGLEADATALKAHPSRTIVIEGHCDERGTMAYNLVLGKRRAQAAQRYLQNLGVPVSQIEIASYGKERPFCTEHSEACWQSNRRAHFRYP